MAGRSRLILIIALAGIALLAGGAYAYWFFLLRGPLAGETSHNFGDVAMEGNQPVKVTHTFHLTNRLDQPLRIVAVRGDCGCVTTPDLKLTLQPSESFDLPITLQTRPGPRTALVTILFDDDRQQTLRVEAFGQLQPQLIAAQPTVLLRAGDAAEFEFIAHLYGDGADDEPAAPTITPSHETLAVEFRGWRLGHRPADTRVSPVAWEGRLRVSWRGEGPLPEGASFTVSLPPAGPLTVSVAAGPPGPTGPDLPR